MSGVAGSSSNQWFVGSWFDLLFLANIAWPLVFLIAYSGDGFEGRDGVQFWQVYFVTTPHRWITLFLVFLDRDRLQSRPATFIGLAVLVVAVCSIARLATGTLYCLLMVDYLWNAWHFAAQHHGIYRLYNRSREQGDWNWPSVEKGLMRLFLLFVTARVATVAWTQPEWQMWLLKIDWLFLVAPLLLMAGEAVKPGPVRWGSVSYLLSVMILYTSLLWSVHTGHPRAVLALTTASALFHATEYLAVVSWSVRHREQDRGTRMGWLHWFAVRWGLTLLAYVTILGIGSWIIEQRWINLWLFLNVIAAFLHYAFDGIIWRKPRRGPQTSELAVPIRLESLT